MLNTSLARRGIAVASHALAAQSASAVLREGGNAIEAMVAAASSIAVVYPHMTGIGGDAFWLIAAPGQAPIAIDASGGAAGQATLAFYAERHLQTIPTRGPLAANTVAGTIGGWAQALELSTQQWGGRLPLARLLADSIFYARDGVPVTLSQQRNTENKRAELQPVTGFAERFMPDGQVPLAGRLFKQTRLANTLEQLTRRGLDDFYRGELAQSMAEDLRAIGSPLQRTDLEHYRAKQVIPLQLSHRLGTLYNMTPPTQGVVSLAILGILDRLGISAMQADSVEHIHAVVEATKLAFLELRDKYITDPAYMQCDAQSLLEDAALQALSARVDPHQARPWGSKTQPGDTIWMGVIDNEGRAVSFIQSIYHEFGAGIVLPGSHVNWQNRGCSFSLNPAHVNVLHPGKKPFHTLNPALARFHDGRVMVYGTMGGDGQPQTQAAVFTRYAEFQQPVQQAVTAPRWLLGRTWGSASETLKLESRFSSAVIEALRARGHDVEVLGDFEETMGHAGALVRHPDGVLEGGFDPRGDGAVAGF